MGTHRWTVWIDASPEQVFAIYTDINRLPEWEAGIREIEDGTGPGDRPGTTYSIRVDGVFRPSRLVTRTTGVLGLQARGTSELIPEAGGTRLTIVYETTWPYRWLGRLLEKAMLNPSTLRRQLNNLKALVEREDKGEESGA